jgi:DNA invertase Pin-like site-specific DNA recombinase
MTSGSTRRAALYLRVSTTDRQTTVNQERELQAVARRSAWQIVEVYKDHGISGAKGRDGRPAFDRLCKDATRRKFEIVMAWSVDRLGRSLQDLIGFLNDLHGVRCDLYLHQQAVDTTTPAGKALFQMLGVFAEFERSLIRARVLAGLKRAKAAGKVLGRPKVEQQIEQAIRARLKTGKLGLRKIAKELGVGTSTVQRVKQETIATA